MRFGAVLEVEELEDGVRIHARDWPYAGWLAAPCLVVGLPLLAWSAANGHMVELGGALVFAGIGAFCAGLSLRDRRGVELRRRDGAFRLTGAEGAGPFRRAVEHDASGPVDVDVSDLPALEGAPDLPDRGADLVLRAAEFRYRLVRAAGPRRGELAAARTRILAALSGGAGA